jgi:hypothetical protein
VCACGVEIRGSWRDDGCWVGTYACSQGTPVVEVSQVTLSHTTLGTHALRPHTVDVAVNDERDPSPVASRDTRQGSQANGVR